MLYDIDGADTDLVSGPGREIGYKEFSSQVRFSRVTQADYGAYQCKVTNDIGPVTIQLTLQRPGEHVRMSYQRLGQGAQM